MNEQTCNLPAMQTGTCREFLVLYRQLPIVLSLLNQHVNLQPPLCHHHLAISLCHCYLAISPCPSLCHHHLAISLCQHQYMLPVPVSVVVCKLKSDGDSVFSHLNRDSCMYAPNTMWHTNKHAPRYVSQCMYKCKRDLFLLRNPGPLN